jgi:hypothetical protein
MPRKCCQTKPMDSRLETLQSVAVPVVAGGVAAPPDQPIRHSPLSDRPMRTHPLSRRRPMGKFHAEARPTEEELLTARLLAAAAKARRVGAAANRRGEAASEWIGERRPGVGGRRRDTTHLVRPTAVRQREAKVCGHFLSEPGGYNQRCHYLGLPIAPSYMSPNAGEGCGV